MSLASDIALAIVDRIETYEAKYENYTEGLAPKSNPVWYRKHSNLAAEAAALLASRGNHPLLAGLGMLSDEFAPGKHFEALMDKLLPAPVDYLPFIRSQSANARPEAQEAAAAASIAKLGEAETVLSLIVGSLMLDQTEAFKREAAAANAAREAADATLAQQQQAARAAINAFESFAARKPKKTTTPKAA